MLVLATTTLSTSKMSMNARFRGTGPSLAATTLPTLKTSNCARFGGFWPSSVCHHNPKNEHKDSFRGSDPSPAATTLPTPKTSEVAHFLGSGCHLSATTTLILLWPPLPSQPQKRAITLFFGVLAVVLVIESLVRSGYLHFLALTETL